MKLSAIKALKILHENQLTINEMTFACNCELGREIEIEIEIEIHYNYKRADARWQATSFDIVFIIIVDDVSIELCLICLCCVE